MNERIEANYIYFYHDKKDDKPKTQVWNVFAKQDNEWLGQVRWFSRWRCYAFSSTAYHDGKYGRFVSDIMFEHNCLRDIANFCQTLTVRHRMELKK